MRVLSIFGLAALALGFVACNTPSPVTPSDPTPAVQGEEGNVSAQYSLSCSLTLGDYHGGTAVSALGSYRRQRGDLTSYIIMFNISDSANWSSYTENPAIFSGNCSEYCTGKHITMRVYTNAVPAEQKCNNQVLIQ